MKVEIIKIILFLIICNAFAMDEKVWWQHSIFYQIYPRSFKDSNGDGIGDIKGITEKLDHLKNLNVRAYWLSPIFKSPGGDAGYDISDYYDIDPIFGTMEDFDALLKKSKQLQLKVILDFVPNHSSNEHEWFKKSIKKEEPYTDFYIWRDGITEGNITKPPNNWVSVFGGDAWTWNEERKQYYLHQFAKFQPDLNYRNSKLVEKMKDILKFWLKKGVDGFRIDAVPFLFEDIEMKDEPLSGDCRPGQYCYLKHIYTFDQNETFDMVVQWRDVIKEFEKETNESKVIMTECYSPIDTIMNYYGNSTHDGASFTFNFLLLTELNQKSNAKNVKDIIKSWMDKMPKDRTPNWVIGNHDNSRIANRLGKEKIDSMNMLLLTLPGVAVTYNGEEIGMENGFVSWEETQDPSALNVGEEEYLKYSRDVCRTPFQWSNETNAGFSSAKKTWLPVSDKYLENNLESQIHDPESHYYVYKSLSNLRLSDILINGNFEYENLNENVFFLKRSLKETSSIITIINFSNSTEEVDIPNKVKVVVMSRNSKYKINDIISTNKLQLQPYEAYVFSTID